MHRPWNLIDAILWVSIAKIFIGTGLGAVIVGSLYKFKAFIMTVYGLLLLSNLATVFIVMYMVSNG